jgi:hypothetical protein
MSPLEQSPPLHNLREQICLATRSTPMQMLHSCPNRTKRRATLSPLTLHSALVAPARFGSAPRDVLVLSIVRRVKGSPPRACTLLWAWHDPRALCERNAQLPKHAHAHLSCGSHARGGLDHTFPLPRRFHRRRADLR